MYPKWRRDLLRKQTGRVTGVGVQIPSSPLCSRSPSGRGNRTMPPTGGRGPFLLSPVRGGFKSLREYIPLYQNGIWIRLRTGGLRVQIPPRVFFGMWRNGRRAVLRPQSARLRVRLPPYRFHGGLPQRKTGPVQTRFSEGSNPLSFIYNQQERGE